MRPPRVSHRTAGFLGGTAVLALLLMLAGAFPAAGDDGDDGDDPYARLGELADRSRKVRREAAKALIAGGDRGLIPGLVDHVFFTAGALRSESFKVLEALAGEKVERNYRDWVEWVGAHRDLTPAPGYTAFKLSLLTRIDRRYRNVFYDGAPTRIRVEEIVWGGVAVDGIPPLDDPHLVPAAEADYLQDDELVFGVDLGGEQRAYPLRHLSWHEMLNDVVGAQPITLSYCTLCGSGILYDVRTPAGGAYTFGTSGLLYRSNKLMYDRQSWSLWSNLTGEAVIGRAALGERRLPILPMTLTTWDAWLRAHPATTTLALRQPDGAGAGFDYRPGAADRARAGVSFPIWQRDDTLDDKDEIYALAVDGKPKAWALEPLLAERVLNDRLGEQPLVLIAEPASGAVRVYARGERTFTATDQARLVADDQGRRWRAEEASLVALDDGETLAPLPRVAGHVAFWFGWYAFYPHTEVWAGDG